MPAGTVDLDLDRFDDLVSHAEAHARVGGRGAARATLESALALVRGQVLEDEPYASWALPLRDRYAEREVAVRLAAADHALGGGDPAVALTHARTVLAGDPAREAAHRVTMLACYRLGRQDEALRTYERCRQALAAELGVDPLPETVGLHAAILRRDDAILHAPPPPSA
ncbi:MAG: hypothetical protein GEU88_21200, partial [Solirubrobacterales bacterium]|nr:hypothetical protein [Solirubrobacterales bacterium]